MLDQWFAQIFFFLQCIFARSVYNYLPTIQDTKQLPLFTHSISTTFAKKFSLDMAQLRELYLDGTVLMRDPHPSTT